MVFAHDTELNLDYLVALVNSGHQDPDPLADLAGLAAFLSDWQWSNVGRQTNAGLARIRDLRPELEQLWHVDEAEAVRLVNEMLEQAQAVPRLVIHDAYGYHVHATPDDAPLDARMKVEAAMAFVDIIRGGELARLRTCAAEDCDDVLVDLTKNRSRRFCSTTCSNRTNVAAFRARRTSG